MNHPTVRVVLLCLTACCLACTGPRPESLPSPGRPGLSILFVGNSLTFYNDLPEMVEDLLATAGEPVKVASSSFGDYGLEDHWNDRRTRQAIAAGGWSHVVFQQGPSATEGRPSLLEYGSRFAGEVTAAGARPGFYMVWPASRRRFDFDGVAESYAMAAERSEGLLFPVGDAWRAVWRHDPDAELYGEDRFHPSVLGSYVAALTIADRLVGADLRPSHRIRTATVRKTIDPQYGDLLLAAVREANARHPTGQ